MFQSQELCLIHTSVVVQLDSVPSFCKFILVDPSCFRIIPLLQCLDLWCGSSSEICSALCLPTAYPQVSNRKVIPDHCRQTKALYI